MCSCYGNYVCEPCKKNKKRELDLHKLLNQSSEEEKMTWIEKWRLNSYTYEPEKVRILPVSETYCLVEGDDNTSYMGSLYDSPADCFVAAYREAHRRIERARGYKELIDRAHQRFIDE